MKDDSFDFLIVVRRRRALIAMPSHNHPYQPSTALDDGQTAFTFGPAGRREPHESKKSEKFSHAFQSCGLPLTIDPYAASGRYCTRIATSVALVLATDDGKRAQPRGPRHRLTYCCVHCPPGDSLTARWLSIVSYQGVLSLLTGLAAAVGVF